MKQVNSFSPPSQAPGLSSGFTLIEALVTVVVMSIGMLGLAAMQSASVRFAYDSYLRTQTSFMAADLFDRMRANPSVNYDDLTATTSTNCASASADCDAATMMQFDMAQWTAQAGELFPDADVEITTNTPAPFHTYTIEFKWNSRTTDGGRIGTEDNRQTLIYVARVKE